MLLHPLDIFQTQLGLDNLHISNRVNFTLDMDNFRVIKRADDLENPIDATNVRKESVAQPRTRRRARGQTGDIDAGEEGGDARNGFV
jgi:hypothetical protein